MSNDPCRLRIPREGRDQLAEQIEAWARAKGRSDIWIQDDLWVVVDADSELCNVLSAYFKWPVAWEGGFQDFSDALGAFVAILSEGP